MDKVSSFSEYFQYIQIHLMPQNDMCICVPKLLKLVVDEFLIFPTIDRRERAFELNRLIQQYTFELP